jgi:hypothetical protein
MAVSFIAITLVGFIPDAMNEGRNGEGRRAAAVPGGAAPACGADGVVPVAVAVADMADGDGPESDAQLEQWQEVQHIIRTRHPCMRDPRTNFLLGILHDELGRPMKTRKGAGGRKRPRYYTSEHVGWARGYGVGIVHVAAGEVEQLTLSTIQSFFADRALLRDTILSLGVYSSEVASALRRGQLAARRISLMDKDQLRNFIAAVVARAHVNRTHLCLLLTSYEVYRFLVGTVLACFKRRTYVPRARIGLEYSLPRRV